MTPSKIVLAYSGGLDTSVILVWLQEQYACPVVAFIANLGQTEAEVAEATEKAHRYGASEVHVADLRDEFARDYAFPMARANAVYEGQYLMGSSIGRPLIAARQAALARRLGADAVAHGATGKGNDQIRFDLTYRALAPELAVIAPWRHWDFKSRSDLLAYAAAKAITVAEAGPSRPVSVDSNLLHTSYEGEVLEDPAIPPPPGLLQRVRDPEDAPGTHELVEIGFEEGDPVSVNGQRLAPGALMGVLGEVGARHGIGRLDVVENRIFGFRTRNIYEAPAATLLWHAHRAVESLVLDPEVAQLKEEFVPKYARLVYRGLWFAPEREMLQAAIDHSQREVTGTATLRLYRGGLQVAGRTSPFSRYDVRLATFEDDHAAFDQADAESWLRVTGIRLAQGSRAGADVEPGELAAVEGVS
ncbi:argininosuccinate synthase [Amycolatopsis sp. OK19-0408]|uniref:Argininosuccinate synthase n=1 Tax=Amycolatopsis iheyensis TaxID=2945988 RepID=A0A9X2SIE7_9PSEU|nr:argininosuccinate synthase [Amycolatopsis iheyensis]MCR6482858.1 argininosuccinate synthase [Amycolatopsis iheyensis]